METTTTWTEMGRQEGRQEGRLEGRREEAVALVTRQLQRRLGSIEVYLSDQISQLSLEKIEHLSEALLDFATVADLQKSLAAQKPRA